MVRDPVDMWWSANLDFWRLGIESGAVIALRMARLSGGGATAASEAGLMVTEKLWAAFEAQAGLMTGSFGRTPDAVCHKLVRHYGSKVRANRRRLTRAG